MALEEGEQEVIEGEDTLESAAVDDTVEGGEGDDTLEGAEHIVVTIGDKAPEVDEEAERIAKVPAFVKLRDAHRAKDKENAELRRELDALKGVKVDAELGAKPTLEAFNYENDKYESALESWTERKVTIDAANRAKADAQAKADAEFQRKVETYGRAKTEFSAKAPDFADAEIAVDQAFNTTQRGIMLKCAKDVPLTIYALGKNEATLKELAAITDPVEFTWKLSQVETQMKVSSRKQEFKPEARVGGVRVVGGGANAHLDRLREEAARTNDYTKVTAFKKQMAERKSA